VVNEERGFGGLLVETGFFIEKYGGTKREGGTEPTISMRNMSLI
jgi:hypothetical protein